MRISWNWLSEHVDLSGLSPAQVAEKLTLSGLEVEQTEALGEHLSGVVVGHIISREEHPDADSLALCSVDVGADEPLQIVCGAPNARVGLRAPLATIGTRLPGDFKIKKSKVRGIESFGMLCSAKELAFSEESDGLYELEETAIAGADISDALGLRDTVIELGVTPNRGDALSVYGVAREVAALFGRDRLSPTHAAVDTVEKAVSSVISLSVQDAVGCPRYAAAALEGVRIGPSPFWMQQRLLAVGQRPVNNLVDVTNYILFEYGQPLHAFDLDEVADSKIVVRRAVDGEALTTLDGTERALEAGDLLICDGAGPVAVAGVMGGANSEIGDSTSRVLIECANFAPSTVRKTKSRLKLYTESSYRFERGVDVENIPLVLQRTLSLIVETQRAMGHECTVLDGVLDVYPAEYAAPVIELPIEMPGRILGVDVPSAQSTALLRALGLGVEQRVSALHVTIPAFRPDLERPIDLVEEIGRCIGFDALPSTPLSGELGLVHTRRAGAPVQQDSDPVVTWGDIEQAYTLTDSCVARGYFEVVNWGIGDPALQQPFVEGHAPLKLRNPLGVETSVMRVSLLPGLLENVAHNLAHGEPVLALFELGAVFPPCGTPQENLEPRTFAAVRTGSAPKSWSGGTAPDGMRAILELLDVIGRVYRRPLQAVSGAPKSYAHPARSAAVQCGDVVIGWIGQIHPDVMDGHDVSQAVFGLELNVDALVAEPHQVWKAAEVSKFPSSTRDLALELESGVPWRDVEASILGLPDKLLRSATLFDVYEGEKIAAGRKSIAVRFVYQDAKSSLTDKKVDKAHARIVNHLLQTFDATQR
ncbi:MAG: phenylalanyl-tRNA synthetase beta chain [Flavobacteriales bacterium]|jgi:phenylalanyl-tRNA synthetase beta chain